MNYSLKLIAGGLFLSFVAGALFFCTYQEWLVIYWNRPYTVTKQIETSHKKMITFYRQKQQEWVTEPVELLIAQKEYIAMKTVINAWLSWLQDEQVIAKNLQLESILYSPSGYEAYLSFEHNPFDKQWSIRQREQFLYALLKTLKENGCTASLIYFLVHHEPLQDPHIDFSKAWNIQQQPWGEGRRSQK